MTWILIVAIVYAHDEEEAVQNAVKVFDKIYTSDIYEGNGFFDGIEIQLINPSATRMEDPCDAFVYTSPAGRTLLTKAVNNYTLTRAYRKMQDPPSIFDYRGNPICDLEELKVATIYKFNDPTFDALNTWVVPAKAHY